MLDYALVRFLYAFCYFLNIFLYGFNQFLNVLRTSANFSLSNFLSLSALFQLPKNNFL